MFVPPAYVRRSTRRRRAGRHGAVARRRAERPRDSERRASPARRRVRRCYQRSAVRLRGRVYWLGPVIQSHRRCGWICELGPSRLAGHVRRRRTGRRRAAGNAAPRRMGATAVRSGRDIRRRTGDDEPAGSRGTRRDGGIEAALDRHGRRRGRPCDWPSHGIRHGRIGGCACHDVSHRHRFPSGQASTSGHRRLVSRRLDRSWLGGSDRRRNGVVQGLGAAARRCVPGIRQPHAHG